MKEKIVLIMSVVVGALAFLLTHRYIRSREADLKRREQELFEGAQKVDIVVAGADLPKGTIITPDDIRWRGVFRNSVLDSHIRPDQFKHVLKKKLLYSVKRGDPILWTYIDTPFRPSSGLAGMIAEDMRAVSISVSGEAAVSGLVRPNDRVDILGTFSFPSPSAAGEWETVTFTLLQNVTVLATGQQLARMSAADTPAGRRVASYNAVTFELSPSEAELLVFADSMKGQLTLSLRNPDDVSHLTEEQLRAVRFDDLQNNIRRYNEERQRRQKSGTWRNR